MLASSPVGFGGERNCPAGGQHRRYCCKGALAPAAFTNCKWYGKVGNHDDDQWGCDDACPANTLRAASNLIWSNGDAYPASPANADKCFSLGHEGYCCFGPGPGIPTRSVDPGHEKEGSKEFDAYLDKFFEDPTCPVDYTTQFGPDTILYGRDLNASLSARGRDQSDILPRLIPMFVTWIASRTFRDDFGAYWNNHAEKYNSLHDTNIVDNATIRSTLFPHGYNGQPQYNRQAYVAEILCNIAESRDMLQQLAASNEILCEKEEVSLHPRSPLESTWYSKRIMSPEPRPERVDGNRIPTIQLVLQGIMRRELSPMYGRWIRMGPRSEPATEVLLEIVFWIGPTLNVEPVGDIRNRYQDTNHALVSRDRYVVIHFHVPLDANTFNSDPQGNIYPGATAMGLYHGQLMRNDVDPVPWVRGRTTDPRVEWRYNRDESTNQGAMRNFNQRRVPLRCDLPTRWYVGRDQTNRMVDWRARMGFGDEATTQASALHDFGRWLYHNNIFSRRYLGMLWPDVEALRRNTNGFFTLDMQPKPDAFTITLVRGTRGTDNRHLDLVDVCPGSHHRVVRTFELSPNLK